jgi:ribosomal protein L24E
MCIQTAKCFAIFFMSHLPRKLCWRKKIYGLKYALYDSFTIKIQVL